MNGPEIEFDWDEANTSTLLVIAFCRTRRSKSSSTIRWTFESRSLKGRSAISTLAQQRKAAFFSW
jgi:hypothetical protein